MSVRQRVTREKNCLAKYESLSDHIEVVKKEEISLKVHFDNSNVSEVRLALYRYDGSSCLAQVDGETVALVDRSSVVALIEAVNSIVLKNEEEK